MGWEMVPMQMPFGITTVAGKKNTDLYIFVLSNETTGYVKLRKVG